MVKLFKSHTLNIYIKIKLLLCHIFSIPFYGMESWTLNEETETRLETFETWLYRRILRFSRADRVTNKAVTEVKKPNLVEKRKKMKLEYVGYIMRNQNKYRVLKSILQKKVYGRRGQGRRKIPYRGLKI